jgi:hypothetical protein
LNNSQQLYEKVVTAHLWQDQTTAELSKSLICIYQMAINSANLLYKCYNNTNNKEILTILNKTHQELAQFMKKWIDFKKDQLTNITFNTSIEETKKSINKKIENSEKSVYKTIMKYKNYLDVDLKSHVINYEQTTNKLQIILCHIDNTSEDTMNKIAERLFPILEQILTKLLDVNTNTLNSQLPELKRVCFLLLNKFGNNLNDCICLKFLKYFASIYLRFIAQNDRYACLSVIPLLEYNSDNKVNFDFKKNILTTMKILNDSNIIGDSINLVEITYNTNIVIYLNEFYYQNYKCKIDKIGNSTFKKELLFVIRTQWMGLLKRLPHNYNSLLNFLFFSKRLIEVNYLQYCQYVDETENLIELHETFIYDLISVLDKIKQKSFFYSINNNEQIYTDCLNIIM